jgi:cation diffusion facilitator CzcD-associated flavoprotein CzcO
MGADVDIVILGAGLGGIGIASRLKAAGRQNFIVIEQADGPGGTWRDNIYPGAACDTESHLYCYSFALHLDVSRLYARQPELLRYAQRLVAQHGLEPHMRYRQRIVSAEWDDSALMWRIGLADGAELITRVFIAAWGQLNRPYIPAFAGAESFAGIAFHSARWPAGLDLSGRRVVSIGNAASAVQYIPEIAPAVAHLTVFQRSPNWIVPRSDRAYSAEELALYAGDPDAFRKSKAELFAWRETTFKRMLEGSDDAQELEAIARAHVAAQVPDAALRAKLIPDFPLGCKRVLRSDDYFPALMRSNVTLETAPIERLVPRGVLTADGRLHEADTIIYGTGFETQSFQGPVEVEGTGGCRLRDVWADGAHAYLGIAVSGFPNLFLIYGPNTNLGHNSILSMLEAQFGYILGAIDRVLETPARAIDVRPNILRAYDQALQASMTGTAWAGNCTSWYKNASGRIVNNWSGPVEAYRKATEIFRPTDYLELDVAP